MTHENFKALTFSLSTSINVFTPYNQNELITIFEVDQFNFQTGRAAVVKVLEGTNKGPFQVFSQPEKITIELLEIIEPKE